MNKTHKRRIVLASASPRRRELIRLVLENVEIITADVDESTALTVPCEVVMELAKRKASAVAAMLDPDAVVIGADTIVAIDGEILGKPTDVADAKAMLQKLSGRTHQVYTGVAVLYGEMAYVDYACTDVTFDELTSDEIEDYVATGEPMDKAGAYGIQGYASRYISTIRGCYFNVVGLPVNKLSTMLKSID